MFMVFATSLDVFLFLCYCRYFDETFTAILLWLYLGNSQLSVYRTIGPTLVLWLLLLCHVEQSSFIQIVDMNRFFTGTCERLVNRLSEKVVKSRILPKIQVCSENKNKHKI